jgi:hypothetical protein
MAKKKTPPEYGESPYAKLTCGHKPIRLLSSASIALRSPMYETQPPD